MDLPVSVQNAGKSPVNVSVSNPRPDHRIRTELLQREARVPGVEKALVIDDHLPTSEFIGEVLRACEIETYNTSDSKLAEARLRREKFDVVFVDAKMPAPDGLELARRIRASGPNKRATIVMITGEQGHDFMKRVFEAGVNFVVFKPVDRQALMRLLRVTQGSVERERRRYARINAACKVVMEFKGQNSFGTTIDMSLTGMRVKMNRLFPVNSIVAATLELTPDAPKLTFKCRIVRQIDDDCMGVEYEGLDEQESQKLEAFLLPRVLEMARRRTMTPLAQAAPSEQPRL
ncbi:MAG TPA: response regulator [Candidatus Eremiobacteraceae bacterium]|jgi:CheY-like chemotaxis protein|nr:response regulator [Candidatus Eremiobacteraceae bacterium]